jgi:competence ComEA-like helix-hairpin-helix protein
MKAPTAGIRNSTWFPAARGNSGSLLVALLWCLVLLSVVVIGVLHSARIDLTVGKNYGDRIQAHYLALAGIEKAKALLYQDARDRSHSGQHHNGALYDSADDFKDVAFARGEFRIFRRGREDEGGDIKYGVSDEESRLNVNTASAEELAKLTGMTPDIVAAIVDWRDDDNTVSPGGAEIDYYASLMPPYQPRNGPFQTVRELLMVRGVSRYLLLGRDTHQNGLLGSSPEHDREGAVTADDAGWAGIMTVDSSVNDLNAGGEDRVNIQSADEKTLTGVKGITSDIARAIVAYRGQNRFSSIADLLDVPRASNRAGSQGNSGPNNSSGDDIDVSQAAAASNAQGPNSGANSSGPKVVSEDLLRDIADSLTVQSGSSQSGVVNVNTAGLEVLSCLPGLNRQLAQAIISYRSSNGFLANIAWLLKVPGITRDIFKQLAPRVTVRSETFRIISEGKIKSTGARQRIQAIVHVGLNDTSILSWREDDL